MEHNQDLAMQAQATAEDDAAAVEKSGNRWMSLGKKALAGVAQAQSQISAGIASQGQGPSSTAPDATDIIFDRRDQLEKIQAGLLPGESLEAVFDLKGVGTGFLGITSGRIIFYDQVFLRKMKAVVSIPYSRIISVGAKDESGILTGRGFFSTSQIYVTTANSEHEFDFRGADSAHIAHNLIVRHLL